MYDQTEHTLYHWDWWPRGVVGEALPLVAPYGHIGEVSVQTLEV